MTTRMLSRGSRFSAVLDFGVELLMQFAPQNPLSMRIKSWALRKRGAFIGSRVKIWRDVWIDDYQKVRIGDDVTIGKSAMLIAGGGIEICDRVMVAHGTRLLSGGHRVPETRDEPMRWSGPSCAPIRIMRDAWIGAGATVLQGVEVGEGSIVAAGAVVTRHVPPFTVVAGVPARVVRERPPSPRVDT